MGALLPNAVCDEELAFLERPLLHQRPQSKSSVAPPSRPHLCGWRAGPAPGPTSQGSPEAGGPPHAAPVFSFKEVFGHSEVVFVWLVFCLLF